jgi:hypothetical protein
MRMNQRPCFNSGRIMRSRFYVAVNAAIVTLLACASTALNAQIILPPGEAEARKAATGGLEFDQFHCESPCVNLAQKEREKLRLLIEVQLRDGVTALNACTDRYFAESGDSSSAMLRYAKREGILASLETSAGRLNYKYACDWRTYSGFASRRDSLEDRMMAAKMALTDASMLDVGVKSQCAELTVEAELLACQESELSRMEEQVGEAIYAIAMARVSRGSCPIDPEFERLLERGLAEYRVTQAPNDPFFAALRAPCAAPGR